MEQINNQLAVMSAAVQSSQKLVECLMKLETNERTDAKMDLMIMSGDLMPNGVPNFLDVVRYPMIKSLVATEGKKKMLVVLTLLVKDFCGSVNVVRNMNEDQMIEAAGMLLNECDNFRLEDYVMMFQMAKQGELVEIRDRIDLQIITSILDEYWKRRHSVAEKDVVEEINMLEGLGSNKRISEINGKDGELFPALERITNHFKEISKHVVERIGDKDGIKRLSEIEKSDIEAIRKRKKELGYTD